MSLKQDIENDGYDITYHSTPLLILNSLENIYWVNFGNAELYVTRYHGASHDGPLHYVTTIPKNNFIFPILDISDKSDICFCIRLNHDTKLIALRSNKFELIVKNNFIKSLKLITEWVRLLSLVAIVGKPPSRPHVIDVNSSFQLTTDASICGNKKLCWVNSKNQTGLFLSDVKIEFPNQSVYFPITFDNWIDFNTSALISTVETKHLVERSALLNNILFFNTAIYKILTVKLVLNLELYTSIKIIDKLNQEKQDFERSEIVLSSIGNSNIFSSPYMKQHSIVSVFAHMSSYLGFNVNDLKIHENQFQIDEKLKIMFERCHIAYRKVYLSDDWYCHDNGYLIGYKVNNHNPEGLVPINGRNYYSITSTKPYIINEKNQHEYANNAYELYVNFPEPIIAKNSIFKKLFHLVSYDVKWVVSISFLLGLLQLSFPILTRILIDEIIPNHDVNNFYWLFFTLGVLIIVSYLFTLTRGYSVLRIRDKVGNMFQIGLWDRLLRLPLPFFDSYTVGDLGWHINAAKKIKDSFDVSAIEIFLNSIFGLVNVVLLFYFSPYLASFSIILLIFYFFIMSFLAKKVYEINEASRMSDSRLTGVANQIINGIYKIRSTASEIRAFNFWVKAYEPVRRKIYQIENIKIILNVFIDFIPYFSILILVIITSLMRDSSLSTGSYIAFYMAYSALFVSVSNLNPFLLSFLDIIPYYHGTKDITSATSETTDHGSDLTDIYGNIELSDVVFSYPGSSKNIINHVSLKINAGEFVGIVGASASGKSTLIKLIVNFYKPKSGHVFIDGMDLISVDTQAMRSIFGITFQDDQLLPDTIYRNIVGNNEIPDSLVNEMINLVGLNKDLDKMPLGIHTLVNIAGGGLSSGQKQKILFARMLILKPKVIIIDDSMSAMDCRSQNLIINLLKEINITRIIVTHRRSALKNADRIFVMTKGKVIEE